MRSLIIFLSLAIFGFAYDGLKLMQGDKQVNDAGSGELKLSLNEGESISLKAGPGYRVYCSIDSDKGVANPVFDTGNEANWNVYYGPSENYIGTYRGREGWARSTRDKRDAWKEGEQDPNFIKLLSGQRQGDIELKNLKAGKHKLTCYAHKENDQSNRCFSNNKFKNALNELHNNVDRYVLNVSSGGTGCATENCPSTLAYSPTWPCQKTVCYIFECGKGFYERLANDLCAWEINDCASGDCNQENRSFHSKKAGENRTDDRFCNTGKAAEDIYLSRGWDLTWHKHIFYKHDFTFTVGQSGVFVLEAKNTSFGKVDDLKLVLKKKDAQGRDLPLAKGHYCIKAASLNGVHNYKQELNFDWGSSGQGADLNTKLDREGQKELELPVKSATFPYAANYEIKAQVAYDEDANQACHKAASNVEAKSRVFVKQNKLSCDFDKQNDRDGLSANKRLNLVFANVDANIYYGASTEDQLLVKNLGLALKLDCSADFVNGQGQSRFLPSGLDLGGAKIGAKPQINILGKQVESSLYDTSTGVLKLDENRFNNLMKEALDKKAELRGNSISLTQEMIISKAKEGAGANKPKDLELRLGVDAGFMPTNVRGTAIKNPLYLRFYQGLIDLSASAIELDKDDEGKKGFDYGVSDPAKRGKAIGVKSSLGLFYYDNDLKKQNFADRNGPFAGHQSPLSKIFSKLFTVKSYLENFVAFTPNANRDNEEPKISYCVRRVDALADKNNTEENLKTCLASSSDSVFALRSFEDDLYLAPKKDNAPIYKMIYEALSPAGDLVFKARRQPKR